MYKVEVYCGYGRGWEETKFLGVFDNYVDANFAGAIYCAKSKVAGWSNDRDYRVVKVD